jgi:predicted nucleotidyltransferase
METCEATELAGKRAGREVAICSLVGSRCHNLHTETSDHDYIAFVMPSLEDMYERDEYYGEVKGNGFEIRIHDLRKLPDLLWKSNPSYLELIFSRDMYMCGTMRGLLYTNRERIAKMNLPYLYNSSIGQFHYRVKYLEKGTGNTQHLVKMFGYDTKQAAHAYRMLCMLQWFADGGNFEDALIYGDGAGERRREHLLNIKKGRMTLSEMKEALEHKFTETEERYRNRYLNSEADRDMQEAIRTGVKEFILKRVENEIREKKHE